MEKQGFDDAFRDAFKEAAASPSGNAWTNIELELERVESGKIKRRLLFYKMLAAASIAFAMVFGGAGLYIMQRDISQKQQQGIAVNQPAQSSQQLSAQDKHIVPSATEGDNNLIASGEASDITDASSTDHHSASSSQHNSSAIAGSEAPAYAEGTTSSHQQNNVKARATDQATANGGTTTDVNNRNLSQPGMQPQRLATATSAGAETGAAVRNNTPASSTIASNNRDGNTGITKGALTESNRKSDQSASTLYATTTKPGDNDVNRVGKNSTDRVDLRSSGSLVAASNGAVTKEINATDNQNGRKINAGIAQIKGSQQMAVASPVLPEQSATVNSTTDLQSSSAAVTSRDNVTSAKAPTNSIATTTIAKTNNDKNNPEIGTQQSSQQHAISAPAFNPWQSAWAGSDFNNGAAGQSKQQVFASKIAADSSFRISRGYNNNFSVALDKDVQESIRSGNALVAGSKGTTAADHRDPRLPVLVDHASTKVVLAKEEPTDEELLLASITPVEEEVKEKKKVTEDEKLWTSVGFSAGTFSSVKINTATSEATTMNSAYAASALANEAEASGTTYAAGIVVGGRVSEHWVVQGGINYLSQSSNYQSDVVIRADRNIRPASVSEVNKFASLSDQASYVNTAPYNVNNSLQFISIPVQAGYVLLNRAFGIQLNGGVSTDLFIQNVITPDKGSLDKITNGRGADSPYRPLNFSGLVGTEFTYRFGSRYRLAVNPGVRYPFSSIYKPEADLEATPVTFDVGVRFRYIFK